MKNLAGDKKCDADIKSELYLAGIETIPAGEHTSEVPYTVVGRIGNWRLRRAWTYWVATVEHLNDGMPLEAAMELHNTPDPIIDGINLGQTIRSGGHCGCPAPDEYGADPDYDDEDFNNQLKALGYKEEYWKVLDKSAINITVGEVNQLCKEGKVKTPRYVMSYHIDDQIGLNEFAKFLRDDASIDKKIKKYKEILDTLKENRSNAVEGDQYDYETDIKNTAEFIRDLKSLKK